MGFCGGLCLKIFIASIELRKAGSSARLFNYLITYESWLRGNRQFSVYYRRVYSDQFETEDFVSFMKDVQDKV